MKVYISKTFEKFISKNLGNYYIDFTFFSKELKKAFLGNIYLKRPLMKFKIRINKLSYRVVGLVKNDKIIPLLVYLKKDKLKGENIIWNKELEILINHYSSKIKINIENNNFNIY